MCCAYVFKKSFLSHLFNRHYERNFVAQQDKATIHPIIMVIKEWFECNGITIIDQPENSPISGVSFEDLSRSKGDSVNRETA